MTTRRDILAAAGAASLASTALAAQKRFEPTWDSLAAGYRTPDWFRDAKLGIWAHWGPQCQPEFGDWYGRKMYEQGDAVYEHHVKTYGHPSKVGFIDIVGQWKADRWDPEALMKRYVAAGARYFVSMANHHDNLDMFASRHHPWNTTRVGPKKDIVGTWAKVARKAGLKFGVSNHSAHAWHWWQTAYGYDPEGPMKGVRYDAYRLTRADGRGKYWQGLDPQQLYTGPNMVVPDGLDAAAMKAWRGKNDGQWIETPPPNNPRFTRQWLLRQNDLVDRYRPDMVYFDNTGLPLGRTGLDATAYYYNQAIAWRGVADVVVNGKKLENDLQRRAIVEDVERGFSDRLRAEPWQTDTCIGQWHYDRRIYEQNAYKTDKQVIQRLLDVVSKNGSMLLNIPMRGDGTIDDKEEKVLDGMAAWMAVNSEAIYSTRPWRRYGEGPTQVTAGVMNEGGAKPFQPSDIRFTTKGGALYAAAMDWPADEMVIASLASGQPAEVRRAELLGAPGPLQFTRDAAGLRIRLPSVRPTFTPVLRIEGPGLAS
jgi:alpha-L-fucosidase